MTEKLTGMLYVRFGKLHGDREDYHQQVCLWCMEAVEKFDPAAGSLGAYLHRHVRNRSINTIRDRVTRADPPCASCHSGSPCGQDGQHCSKYGKWLVRNQTKANLHRPLSSSAHPLLVEARTSPAPSAEETTTAKDLSSLIDRELPVDLRGDYLRMRDTDLPVPLHKRQRVQRAVADILAGAGIDPPECEPGRSRSAAPPQDDDGEQETGGDERPAPLGAQSAPSSSIRELVADQSELSLVA